MVRCSCKLRPLFIYPVSLFISDGNFPNRKPYGEGGSDLRLQTSLENDAIDVKYGFGRHKEHSERVGWLLNMHQVSKIKEYIREFLISNWDLHSSFDRTWYRSKSSQKSTNTHISIEFVRNNLCNIYVAFKYGKDYFVQIWLNCVYVGPWWSFKLSSSKTNLRRKTVTN